jgi:hypothetical protein
MPEPIEEYFLEPKLKGERFDTHSIPLDLLQDFAALQDLLVELAKDAYLKQNNRQRVPKGFAKGVSVNLQQVDEGSVWLKLVLALNLATSSMPIDNFQTLSYFETAKKKIIEVVQVAHDGGDVSGLLPKKFLSYFDKIGKNLLEDETIEFNPRSKSPAVLSRKTRNLIMLSASENHTYVDKFSFNAKLAGIYKRDKTFSFLVKGNEISASINREHLETLANGFADPFSDSYVFVEGEAVFNGQDKILSVNNITTLDPLDPLDVSIRMEQLSELRDGWYDGEGLSPNPLGLSRFESYFNENWTFEQALPAIFPTVDGNIQLEWSTEFHEISVEVNLSTMKGEYLRVNVEKVVDVEDLILDFTTSGDWKQLEEKLREVHA